MIEIWLVQLSILGQTEPYLGAVEEVQLLLLLSRGGVQHCRVGVGGRVAQTGGLAEGTTSHAMPGAQEAGADGSEDDVATRVVSKHPTSTQSRVRAQCDWSAEVSILPVFGLNVDSKHFV